MRAPHSAEAREHGHEGIIFIMPDKSFAVRRPALVLPSGSLFGLCLIALTGIPDIGGRLFLLPIALLTGLWFERCCRLAVIMSDAGVTFRGQLRSRRYAWGQIETAGTGPLQTISPLASSRPYVNLELRLAGGKVTRFPELAAPRSSDQRLIQTVASEINRRIATRRYT